MLIYKKMIEKPPTSEMLYLTILIRKRLKKRRIEDKVTK